MKLSVKLETNGIAPSRRDDSAGYDCFCREDIKISALSRVRFGLGFAASFDSSYFALLLDRSSIGNKGVLKLAGVIEGTYRDEWQAILYNTSHETFMASAGSRIIQAIFLEYKVFDLEIVNELPISKRGIGGFGSTEILNLLAMKGLKLPVGYGRLDLDIVTRWIDQGAKTEDTPECLESD